MTDTQLLTDCIRACATARDGRGRWRVEQATAAKLARPGESAGISAMQAAAARRLGEWLATQKLPVVKGENGCPCGGFTFANVTSLMDNEERFVCGQCCQPVRPPRVVSPKAYLIGDRGPVLIVPRCRAGRVSAPPSTAQNAADVLRSVRRLLAGLRLSLARRLSRKSASAE